MGSVLPNALLCGSLEYETSPQKVRTNLLWNSFSSDGPKRVALPRSHSAFARCRGYLYYQHHYYTKKQGAKVEILNAKKLPLVGLASYRSSHPIYRHDWSDDSHCWVYLFDRVVYCHRSRLDYDSENGGNMTTLNRTLSVLELVPNRAVADMMTIQGGFLCYEYVWSCDLWYDVHVIVHTHVQLMLGMSWSQSAH